MVAPLRAKHGRSVCWGPIAGRGPIRGRGLRGDALTTQFKPVGSGYFAVACLMATPSIGSLSNKSELVLELFSYTMYAIVIAYMA